MSAIESNVMVNPLNDSHDFNRIEADNRTQHKQPTASEKHAGETNPVSLSDTSKQMTALKELILSAPEVNRSLVEFLKEELTSGHYRIISDQIATKMFADIEMA